MPGTLGRATKANMSLFFSSVHFKGIVVRSGGYGKGVKCGFIFDLLVFFFFMRTIGVLRPPMVFTVHGVFLYESLAVFAE